MTLIAPIRPWPGRLAPIWWASRALANELFRFRFRYPLEVVATAGPRESLHYYLYSERLFFDAMELDPDGIPVHRSRTFGPTYNPSYVAWYGLTSLERALRGSDPGGSETFLRQMEWLIARAVRWDDGSIVWPYTFDLHEGQCELKAPWICAMAQGLAISVLVRGCRMTGRQDLVHLCRAATRVFEKSVEEGGLRTFEAGHALYEEYPAYPLPRVLDGFLFSLLGLYDLFAQTNDPQTFRLFADGIEGLKHWLPWWDYRGKWSWYGSHGYLSPPRYNELNCALLTSLASLSGEQTLRRYAEAWTPARLTPLGRAEVFLAFAFTKNRSRLKYLLARRLP